MDSLKRRKDVQENIGKKGIPLERTGTIRKAMHHRPSTNMPTYIHTYIHTYICCIVDNYRLAVK